jgi:hypothetical protein
MQLDKSAILDLLRSQGAPDKATIAEAQLPDKVDTEQHAGLLAKLGLNPQELVEKLVAGKASGALGGLLGGKK